MNTIIIKKPKFRGIISPPPKGYVDELAKLCGCSRVTVSAALRNNARGKKAHLVRSMYMEKYMNMNDEPIEE